MFSQLKICFLINFGQEMATIFGLGSFVSRSIKP